ncbi:MAG: hypothetical protein Q8867_05625 [Bacteroidota bacterium]|nr:hypothetical protein [Bacteroidota bacterium]
MKLRIKNESIFDHSSDGVILTIDGTSKGMGGKVARTFAELYPETWKYIESQAHYPIAFGKCASIPIPDGDPFRYVFLAATLMHLPDINGSSLKAPALHAYCMAIVAATSYGLKTVRCGLPTGGWRIDPLNAFLLLAEVSDKTGSSTKTVELHICIPDKDIFDSVVKFAINIGFDI